MIKPENAMLVVNQDITPPVIDNLHWALLSLKDNLTAESFPFLDAHELNSRLLSRGLSHQGTPPSEGSCGGKPPRQKHIGALNDHMLLMQQMERQLLYIQSDFEKNTDSVTDHSVYLDELSAIIKQLSCLSDLYSRQEVEVSTLQFLKKQLRLRNQELREGQAVRELQEEHLKDREKAFETIAFLRQQLRALTSKRSQEKQNSIDAEEKLKHASTALARHTSVQAHLLDLYQDEVVHASMLETELTQIDDERSRLKDHILNQEETISRQNEEILGLRKKVSMYRRLFNEIKAAFAPLGSLVFRETDDNQLHPIQLIETFESEAASEKAEPYDTDIEAAQPEEYSTASFTRAIKEKIVRFPARLKGSNKKTKEIRWGKISMLLLFFLLTTFGTTDLFSHLKPFKMKRPPDLLRPIENLPLEINRLVSPKSLKQQWLHTYNKLLKHPIVVLDPGHGGFDPGATNKDGWCESDFTLEMSLQIEKYLKKMGSHVILTRRTDRYLSLIERRELANRFPHSLLVSIHLNAHPTWSVSDARGFSVFYNDDFSRPMAENIYNSTISMLYLKSYNKGIIDGRRFFRSGYNHLGLLRNLNNPGVLIETSFISHDDDFKLLKNASFRDRMASNIANGIVDCRGLY